MHVEPDRHLLRTQARVVAELAESMKRRYVVSAQVNFKAFGERFVCVEILGGVITTHRPTDPKDCRRFKNVGEFRAYYGVYAT